MDVLGAIILFPVVSSQSALASNNKAFEYAGISLLQTQYKEPTFEHAFDPYLLTPMQYDETRTNFGFRAFVGHQYSPNWALEIGVSKLGNAEFAVTSLDLNSQSVDVYQGKISTIATDMRINGTYSISKAWFVKGYAGIQVWRKKTGFLTNIVSSPDVSSKKEDGVSLITGAGIGYGINRHAALSLDYEMTELNDLDINNLSFSVAIKF